MGSRGRRRKQLLDDLLDPTEKGFWGMKLFEVTQEGV